ncbi:MAG: hypothetical protein JKX92_05925 [Porticoccaceae bacterium]|nr:hypothetical protein [Porticoccaceae bacterium]
MSEQSHTLSRSNTLIDITNAQFRETGSTALSFSEILFNVFCQKVPANQRTGLAQIRPWTDKEGDAKTIEANYKRFQRYMDGTTAIPADLEEAWVDCLLDRYRARAIVALCSRHGAAAIELEHDLDCAGVSELMSRFANMLVPAGKILADGVVNEDDRPHMADFQAAAQDLISVTGGLLRDLQVRLGPDPAIAVGPRSSTH